MKLFAGRLFSILLVAGAWIVIGVRAVLDLIGYATLPEDSKVAQGVAEHLLLWVLSLPIWLPWGFALIATLMLMWVSWPRQLATGTDALSPRTTPEPSPPLAAEVPRSRRDATDRKFVAPEMTPNRIFGFYKNNTAIQAHELTKHLIGQWIKVTGPLLQVLPRSGSFTGATLDRGDYSGDIFMYFVSESEIVRLAQLNKFDIITVVGQIDEISRLELLLNNCELVDVRVEPPSPPPPPKPARKRQPKNPPG